MATTGLPACGVYLLELRVAKPVTVSVGRLGEVRLETGMYLYVGSAQRNLPARVRRHFACEKRIRWHIDYLTTHPAVDVIGAATWERSREWECRLGRVLVAHGAAAEAVAGFGASDCHCRTHLFRVLLSDWRASLIEPLGECAFIANVQR
jgi:Uri superfamily endonuclease